MERRRLLKLLLYAPVLAHSGASVRAQNEGRVFGSDAGMVLNTIKPENTGEFEMVVERLKAALQQSSDPIRKQQANGWKVFKSLEPGANNSALYVFWINPVVKGADYTVSKILYEAYPKDVEDLYNKFSQAYSGGQTLVNLQLIADYGVSL